MSSIFGFYKISNCRKSISNDSFIRMSKWNKAYGEDSEKSLFTESFAMGCYLEKLSDALETCNPVIKMENRIAVIDAIIYNRTEILEMMTGKVSDLVSDEKLLVMYINEFGYNALEKVNGDFAGAIYNEDDNSITLFRDHMGVRPLFYYMKEGFITFSTDIRGIIAVPEVDTEINEEWLFKILGGYYTLRTEKTEYDNILCVKPGSYIRFHETEKGISKELYEYWTVGKQKVKLESDEEYQHKLRLLIEDSIKKRLDAISGKVGAELSGGLDSGVISILINRFGRDCIYYSWSTSPDEQEMAEGDERLIIKDICDQEGISCNYGHIKLKEDTLFAEKFKKTGAPIDFDEMLGFRFALPPYINTTTIAQTATDIRKLGARVVFSGHGGDEGVSHRCNPYEMFHNKEFYHYFRYMFSTTNGQKNRVTNTLKRCFENLKDSSNALKHPGVIPYNASDLMCDDLKSKFDVAKMPVPYFAFDAAEYVRSGGSVNRLDNAALLGAYGGVRYIFPFLDYRVIDFAVSIPRYQYLRGRKDRYIFREAFHDIMPDSLYRLRLKQTASLKNVEPDPDWYENYKAEKKEIISKFERSKWEKYLDFEKLYEFENSKEPEGDEINKQDGYFYQLHWAAMAQNLLDKVRS